MKKLILALVYLLLVARCQARIITVDANGSADFETIQAAINDSNDGDIVVVRPGIYTGSGNRDIDFKGKAITVRSIEPHEPSVVAATVIDCQAGPFTPHRGFHFYNGEDANSVLDGFTITNGYVSDYGGGILCEEAGPTISNCTISGNTADMFGGGLYWCDGPITNCTISGNTAGGFGGGGLAFCGGPITNCIITGNSAERWGGGLAFCSSPVSNCVIAGNSAVQNGGGLYRCDGSVSNCTISGNTAGEFGGGLYVCNGEVINCILWANSDDGGMDESAQIHGGTSVVTYSCIQGWTSGGTGNISADPHFVDSDNGDYHLKSEAGRWDPSAPAEIDLVGDGFINLFDFAVFASFWHKEGESIPADLDDSGVVDLSDLRILLDNYPTSCMPGAWVFDGVTSPSIDGGDPNSDWTAELWPNGKRINMGTYGGTSQASKKGNIADFDVSGAVNFSDFAYFGDNWQREEVLLPEDLNRDGRVGLADLVIFADKWLWQE